MRWRHEKLSDISTEKQSIPERPTNIIELFRYFKQYKKGLSTAAPKADIPRTEVYTSFTLVALWSIVGLIFFGVGLTFYLIGMGAITTDYREDELTIMRGAGFFFGLPGVFLLMKGLFIAPRATANRILPPWRKKSYWSSGRVTELHPPTLRRIVGFFIVVTVFFGTFLYMVTGGEIRENAFRGPGVFLIPFAGIFYLALLYGLLRAIKYQPSYLQHTGEYIDPTSPLDVALHCPGGLDQFETLAISLAYVHQWEESKNKSQYTVNDVKHHQEKELVGTDYPMNILPLPLRVQFDFPDESTFVTDFDSRTRKFWALSFHGKTAGVDYRAQFILPVFVEATDG
jgi:hypothetical protein